MSSSSRLTNSFGLAAPFSLVPVGADGGTLQTGRLRITNPAKATQPSRNSHQTLLHSRGAVHEPSETA